MKKNFRLPVFSSVAAILALVLMFSASLWLEDTLNLYPDTSEMTAVDESTDSAQESTIGSPGMFHVTDKRLYALFFSTGGILAIVAVATGIRAHTSGDSGHMTAAGIALGLVALIWQLVIRLDVSYMLA